MTLQLGDLAPDFQAETTTGPIRLYDWAARRWVILFSQDFTPVCTTELGEVARRKPEFDRRGVKALGTDSLQLTDAHAVSTPVNWRPDQEVTIAPSISDGEAHTRFPRGWRTVEPYIRLTPDPLAAGIATAAQFDLDASG